MKNMMKKKIELDPIFLIAIVLIVVSLIIGTVAYYNYNNRQCIRNPVEYANNNSYDYWWDYVVPIEIGRIG